MEALIGKSRSAGYPVLSALREVRESRTGWYQNGYSSRESKICERWSAQDDGLRYSVIEAAEAEGR